MRLKYKMSERKGPRDGHSFVVQASIDLDADEKRLHESYDVLGCLVIGREFTEVSGVDTLGDVKLDQFLGGTAEFQFPTIQLAKAFVSKLGDGLWQLRNKFADTRDAIRSLDQDVELEF
ncbi:MAG TPA: hypothetical protein VMF58_10105 [Rhizomicrobium sp.]|nr:hypothetical protein [Rhizomicrobium sp.]